ncbi:hypothetical protein BsWGS_12399 [Bradybaena similaris]
MAILTSCLLCLLLMISGCSAGALTCHSGWHLYKNSCYSYGGGKVTWANAQEFCKAYGGSLAEIENADEGSFVKNLLTTHKAYQAWIGGADILREGHWQWMTSGLDFSEYSNWGPAQPDNFQSAEDCLQYQEGSSGTYVWNDSSCSNLLNFVCESEALTSK